MDNDDVAMNFHYYDGEAGGALRQVALGLEPMIIIIPSQDDDGQMRLDIVGSLISLDQTVNLFEILADIQEG